MHYASSPLIEAIFEIFPAHEQWEDAVWEKLESRLRATYSGKREVLQGMGVQLQLGPGQALKQEVVPQPKRLRLWQADNRRMVQFSPDICALNVLAPYERFEAYLPPLEALMTTFVEEAKPSAVVAFGQRYVNRIVLPSESEPSTYFQIYPSFPPEVARRHPPFQMAVEGEQLTPGSVVTTLTYQGLDAEKPVYLLDLYAQSQVVFSPTWELAHEWQQKAHLAIKRCFEMSITNASRVLFGGREN